MEAVKESETNHLRSRQTLVSPPGTELGRQIFGATLPEKVFLAIAARSWKCVRPQMEETGVDLREA